ncbi:hypothetical protein FJR48_03375 [Sulfurimonas lithotrophica]|uniref:Uncharacterized protein n=1 Tax=Sulfurimonas lithotrophica TaxID=2590022 RepID=A0A5P8NZK7_9BACT|nr:hypothetical protein [Sulfurimonas lithotrophica]QFR48811.1 hypothetical protein FJR48_03375 [Sulfurimonas lithotrophica]
MENKMHNSLIKNMDMILLWMLLLIELNDLYILLKSSRNITFFDIVFNMWFLILILIIYRLYKKENLFDIIIEELNFKHKPNNKNEENLK